MLKLACRGLRGWGVRSKAALRLPSVGLTCHSRRPPLTFRPFSQPTYEFVDFGSPQPTHHCAEIKSKDIGKEVTLCGWVSASRDLGKELNFISLRDGHGVTQVQISNANKENLTQRKLTGLPLESVISVIGVVQKRPEDQINHNDITGELEIHASKIFVLNVASDLPFPFHRKSTPVGEDALLKYRYLDLRQPSLQHNIRLRSTVSKIVRDYFHSLNFVEIETPTLFKSTPEGAREFLVATRQKGKFYSLPQSPQQYKQLLMVGGFHRYFQLARCYRDETSRVDRQPEFTQIDLEMSFVKQEDIMNVTEALLTKIWTSLGYSVPSPFPRMLYNDAINSYGTDRPDTRFGSLIQDLTPGVELTIVGFFDTAVKIFSKAERVKGIAFKGMADGLDKAQIEQLQEEAKLAGGEGVAVIHYREDGPSSNIWKHLSQYEKDFITITLGAQPGDLVLLAAGKGSLPAMVLGRLRTHVAGIMHSLGKLPQLDKNTFNFLWVVDFPLFSAKDEDSVAINTGGELEAEHHPFTAPHPQDVGFLFTEPEKVRAQHYDIVLNGCEIGGGSIRIHSSEMQKRVFTDILKIPPTRLATFQHLLDALNHGAPPHGGIALGFDRLISILCNAPSLRSVIAFPKTMHGTELMTGSPSHPDPQQLKDVYLSVVDK